MMRYASGCFLMRGVVYLLISSLLLPNPSVIADQCYITTFIQPVNSSCQCVSNTCGFSNEERVPGYLACLSLPPNNAGLAYCTTNNIPHGTSRSCGEAIDWYAYALCAGALGSSCAAVLLCVGSGLAAPLCISVALAACGTSTVGCLSSCYLVTCFSGPSNSLYRQILATSGGSCPTS